MVAVVLNAVAHSIGNLNPHCHNCRSSELRHLGSSEFISLAELQIITIIDEGLVATSEGAGDDGDAIAILDFVDNNLHCATVEKILDLVVGSHVDLNHDPYCHDLAVA